MPSPTNAVTAPSPDRADRNAKPAIEAAVSALRQQRADWRARRDPLRRVDSFPERAAMARIVELIAAALYPRRLGRRNSARPPAGPFFVRGGGCG